MLLVGVIDELPHVDLQCVVTVFISNFDAIIDAVPSAEVFVRYFRWRWHLDFRIKGREGESCF